MPEKLKPSEILLQVQHRDIKGNVTDIFSKSFKEGTTLAQALNSDSRIMMIGTNLGNYIFGVNGVLEGGATDHYLNMANLPNIQGFGAQRPPFDHDESRKGVGYEVVVILSTPAGDVAFKLTSGVYNPALDQVALDKPMRIMIIENDFNKHNYHPADDNLGIPERSRMFMASELTHTQELFRISRLLQSQIAGMHKNILNVRHTIFFDGLSPKFLLMQQELRQHLRHTEARLVILRQSGSVLQDLRSQANGISANPFSGPFSPQDAAIGGFSTHAKAWEASFLWVNSENPALKGTNPGIANKSGSYSNKASVEINSNPNSIQIMAMQQSIHGSSMGIFALERIASGNNSSAIFNTALNAATAGNASRNLSSQVGAGYSSKNHSSNDAIRAYASLGSEAKNQALAQISQASANMASICEKSAQQELPLGEQASPQALISQAKFATSFDAYALPACEGIEAIIKENVCAEQKSLQQNAIAVAIGRKMAAQKKAVHSKVSLISNSRIRIKAKPALLTRSGAHASKNAKIKAILFDLDGVLSDSEGLHRKTFNMVLKRYGISIPKKYWFSHYTGTGSRHIFEDILSKNKISEDIDALLLERKLLFQKEVEAGMLPAMPGALRLLNWARKSGLKIAVASGGHRSNIESQLKSLGLEGIFFLGLEDVLRRKPDPEVFLKAAGALGVRPEECIVIEDSDSGISAAKAAGMQRILVGAHHAKSAEANATIYAKKIGSAKAYSFIKSKI